MNDFLFNFVIDCSDDELDAYIQLNEATATHISAKGDLSWCLHAYLKLSQHTSLNVVCSNHLMQDAINIVHAKKLMNGERNPLYFIVSVQADHPHWPFANYHIVQNKTQAATAAFFVPHWVQPGIVKRNENRMEVTKVAFLGSLHPTFIQHQQYLKHIGIELISLQGSWNNLSEIDILVGVRSFDLNRQNNKPPNRLFSSWHAHIPFIGGCDSAYEQVATPGKDYLVALSPEEVIDAIVELKKNGQLYSKIVQNGIEKTLLYNNDAIADLWKSILCGPVAQQYNKHFSCPQYN